MSILSSLFNRKRQTRYSENTEEEKAYLDTEEEESDEETDLDVDVEGKEQLSSEASDSEVKYEVVEREIHPSKIICPDCGGITLEGLDFCDKCGGELL